MNDYESVIQLIENGLENEEVDFKQSYYSKDKRGELLKDICAFANSITSETQYIIFGIENDNKTICGIQEEIEDISCINQLLEENIEPFINVVNGTLYYKDKYISYIKIFNNKDKPYIIKKDYSKGCILKKGDIFIRKGATVFKATRYDIDFIYSNRFKKEVKLYNQYLNVDRVITEDNIEMETGIVQLLFINESNMSISLKKGYIIIRNRFNKIERALFNTHGVQRLDENPHVLKAKVQEVVEFYFDFLSSDCVKLNFNEDGGMNYPTEAKIILIDLENKEYTCDYQTVHIQVKGNMLHKIKRKFKVFRSFLSKEYPNLLKCIENSDRESLRKILSQGDSYFELIQPQFDLYSIECPEENMVFRLIKAVLSVDETMIDIFKQYGLSDDFVKFCYDKMNMDYPLT